VSDINLNHIEELLARSPKTLDTDMIERLVEEVRRLDAKLLAAERVCYRVETNSRLVDEALGEWRRTRGL
jgi:hypothetical protein